jgi:hypothetical protein
MKIGILGKRQDESQRLQCPLSMSTVGPELPRGKLHVAGPSFHICEYSLQVYIYSMLRAGTAFNLVADGNAEERHSVGQSR